MRCFVLGALPFLVWGFASWGDGIPAIPGFIFQDGAYLPDEPYKMGQAKASELQEPFPAMVSVFKNGITPEKAHLGKLLFFDPLLSGDNRLSCAHCHHPDYGFSDGRKTAMGLGGRGVGPNRSGGVHLLRGAPSLWNAAYNPYQFWDGRADDLEAQARGPITEPNEMNEQPARLVAELLEIPHYVRLFREAFGGDPHPTVTFENVTKALATFERTLISFNSPFDRYAQGDSKALREQELRGLALFRSEKTQCAECHPFPLFTDNTFRVIGVPDSEFDLGRGDIEGEKLDGAFKVPTLRNVALTAPYMHNGSFETLEDLIRFYADGAGRDNVFRELIDLTIGRFDMSQGETDDLVAFLGALTDTSLLPKAPERVPSGLPVVPLALAQDTSRDESPTTYTVHPGHSIQAALDKARPGDRIQVLAGLFHQSVTVDKARITLIGMNEDGDRPILDGEGALDVAIRCTAPGVTIEGFVIQNYLSSAIAATGIEGLVVGDLIVRDSGHYGVHAKQCNKVRIEGCVISGASQAGIYALQSRDLELRSNEVFSSVAGIAVVDSTKVLAENNSVHHNTAGMLVLGLLGLSSEKAMYCRIINNRFWSNNLKNVAEPKSLATRLAAGIGVLVVAADYTEVTQNYIADNGSCAVMVMGLGSSKFAAGQDEDPAADTHPDDTHVHHNTFERNGKNPSEQFARDFHGVPPGDLFWDGSGSRNQWQEDSELSTHPEDLLEKQGGIHTNVIHFL